MLGENAFEREEDDEYENERLLRRWETLMFT
jgi:hypothetical protein